MQIVHRNCPHLGHFLNAYMHQDWQIYGKTLESVVAAYIEDTPPDDIAMLHAEIDDLLNGHDELTEAAYHQLSDKIHGRKNGDKEAGRQACHQTPAAESCRP